METLGGVTWEGGKTLRGFSSIENDVEKLQQYVRFPFAKIDIISRICKNSVLYYVVFNFFFVI